MEAEHLEGTNIKVIAHTGGSVADLVAPSVWEAGYKVISGNDMYAESVAEGALTYILMALRRLPHYIKDMKDGGWRSPHLIATNGLLDQTVGLVGMGTITRYLMKMLKPFHVKLKLYSGYPIDEEILKDMCKHCEKYCGKQHDYEECLDMPCFKCFLGYSYLKWETSYE